MMQQGLLICLTICILSIGCSATNHDKLQHTLKQLNTMNVDNSNPATTIDTAIFAAGCFWCVEAQFLSLEGVLSVQSGYTGGHLLNPTYEQVCSGQTGHAEAIKITYDPNIISFDQLLAAFFLAHDPTQLNRQGNDIGTQYRSAIFPINEIQTTKAKQYIDTLNARQVYHSPIVTTIEPFKKFFNAEDYHNNYLANNPQNPYCQMVVKPKLEKFQEVFSSYLKANQ